MPGRLLLVGTLRVAQHPDGEPVPHPALGQPRPRSPGHVLQPQGHGQLLHPTDLKEKVSALLLFPALVA